MADPEPPGPLEVALDPAHVLPRRIEYWFGREPDRPFLVEAETGRRESYGSFRDLTRRWASVLSASGVRSGDRVVSMLPSSVDAHAVWVAASVIGAVEVPVNPELRGEFLRHVLADSGARVCVVLPRQEALIGDSGVEGLRTLICRPDGSITDGIAPMDVGDLPGPADVSCVIYTSGTTGPAKGVVIRWAQMAATIGRIPRAWLSDADAVYSPWPMFHVTGRSPMFAMADVGGRVVLREKFSLPHFWSDIRAHGCTSTTVGAVTGLLLAQPRRPDDRDHPLRCVLFGRVGTEGLEFLDRFGGTGICCYGSTEVGFPILNRTVDAATRDVVGWLRPGYDSRVVDADGADVGPGVVGELWIRPPDPLLIMAGYLNHQERTAAAIVDGWYRTGDAVRQTEDGGFVFVDRMRDTIRRFGENISSAALESVVVADPEVLECAAVGVPSVVAGQEVLLFVVPTPDTRPDPAGLAERLRDALPRFMNPSYIAVVDELPKTPNGKIRKVGLADHLDLSTVWRAGAAPGV